MLLGAPGDDLLGSEGVVAGCTDEDVCVDEAEVLAASVAWRSVLCHLSCTGPAEIDQLDTGMGVRVEDNESDADSVT